ncbi:hypothetical protein INT47_012753 [Mucor saturninus]|uniref:Protein FRA10AC1 n=1 Tax=Mucor saturninus TaxID=64648 RepID=A0A8H7QT81_9FUNG|nr:hypothetical protein INT47_012753 [Mucor saturninus]
MSTKSKLSKCFTNELKGSDAYTRHKKLVETYVQVYRGKAPDTTPTKYKTERDIIQENHKFVRTEEDTTWEQRVAKKYYDKLFKEYAICELKYYKEGKIALRWRTEKEVMAGKGQFMCASTQCDQNKDLQSWEVNFAYREDGEKKNELVKVRLCPDCSDKLNYKTKARLAQTLKRKREEQKASKREKKTRKSHSASSASSSSDQDSENEEEEKKSEPSVWSKPLEKKDEKTKEEEYEDYFADLLQ